MQNEIETNGRIETLEIKVKSLEESLKHNQEELVQVATAMGDILQCLGLKMKKKGDELSFQIVVPMNGSQPGVLPRLFSAIEKIKGERRIVNPFAKNGSPY